MGYKPCLDYIELRLDEIDLEFQSADKQKRRKLNAEAKFLGTAKDAIKKQVPLKPQLVYGEKTNTHRYGRLVSIYCPVCGRYMCALYETDVEMGGGVRRTTKGCPDCLQAIDFSDWYCRETENDEVAFDD